MQFIVANTITADMGLIPGLAIVGPLMGLPLSVMAAIIERPFLTAAGHRHHTIWYSIQANVVSLLVGYPLVFAVAMFFGARDALLTLWPFAAVAISTAVERAYLNWRMVDGPRLSFRGVAYGNAVSALICVLLILPLHALDQPELKRALQPFQTILSGVLGAVCLVAVGAAFLVPRLSAPASPPVA